MRGLFGRPEPEEDTSISALLLRLVVAAERIALVMEQDSPSPANTLRSRVAGDPAGVSEGSFTVPNEAEFQQWFLDKLREENESVDILEAPRRDEPLFPGFSKQRGVEDE